MWIGVLHPDMSPSPWQVKEHDRFFWQFLLVLLGFIVLNVAVVTGIYLWIPEQEPVAKNTNTSIFQP